MTKNDSAKFRHDFLQCSFNQDSSLLYIIVTCQLALHYTNLCLSPSIKMIHKLINNSHGGKMQAGGWGGFQNMMSASKSSSLATSSTIQTGDEATLCATWANLSPLACLTVRSHRQQQPETKRPVLHSFQMSSGRCGATERAKWQLVERFQRFGDRRKSSRVQL